MANCPHCGRKLRLTDWRPNCPDCGVNLNYYDANQRLLDESEKAEKEHALFQPKIDRAKAAYAGSRWAILRIVLTLLPVGALFLPLLKGEGVSANVITVYKKINETGLGAVLGGALKDRVCLAAALLLVSAVMVIVSIVLITMALGKRHVPRVIATYGFMLLCAAGALGLAGANGARLGEIFGAAGPVSPGIGAYLYAALFLVLFAYNLFLLRKGIPVRYTQCLIGGLPSEEYFAYVEQGMSKSRIQRKMLLALAALEEEQERKLEQEGAGNHV